MEESISRWLYGPLVGKFVAAIIGSIILVILSRIFQRSLTRYIKESESRYRARKFVRFVGYLAGAILIASIFSDRLGGLIRRFSIPVG